MLRDEVKPQVMQCATGNIQILVLIPGRELLSGFRPGSQYVQLSIFKYSVHYKIMVVLTLKIYLKAIHFTSLMLPPVCEPHPLLQELF